MEDKVIKKIKVGNENVPLSATWDNIESKPETEELSSDIITAILGYTPANKQDTNTKIQQLNNKCFNKETGDAAQHSSYFGTNGEGAQLGLIGDTYLGIDWAGGIRFPETKLFNRNWFLDIDKISTYFTTNLNKLNIDGVVTNGLQFGNCYANSGSSTINFGHTGGLTFPTATVGSKTYDKEWFISVNSIKESYVSDLANVREVAEGKTNTYILSYQEQVGEMFYQEFNYYKLDGTKLETYQDFLDYVHPMGDDYENGNESFNSQEQEINTYWKYFVFRGATYSDRFVATFQDIESTFKKGDNILVIERDVPDRWYSGSYTLNALETQKVDLSNVVKTSENQTVGGIKTFTSEIVAQEGFKFNDSVSVVKDENNNLKLKGAKILTDGDLLPTSSYDIGSSANRYGDIYLSGKVYTSDNNLGTATNQYNTLYANNLSDGTTTKTMSEVLSGGSSKLDKQYYSTTKQGDLQVYAVTSANEQATFPCGIEPITFGLPRYDGSGSLTVYTIENNYSAVNVQYLSNKLMQKQDTLVSGINIKTINGQSILGNGDFTFMPSYDDLNIGDEKIYQSGSKSLLIESDVNLTLKATVGNIWLDVGQILPTRAGIKLGHPDYKYETLFTNNISDGTHTYAVNELRGTKFYVHNISGTFTNSNEYYSVNIRLISTSSEPIVTLENNDILSNDDVIIKYLGIVEGKFPGPTTRFLVSLTGNNWILTVNANTFQMAMVNLNLVIQTTDVVSEL